MEELLNFLFENAKLIIGIAGPALALLYAKFIKGKFEKEFGTFAKIVGIVADRHDIKSVDLLDELLEEAEKTNDNTKEAEKEIKKERDNLKD